MEKVTVMSIRENYENEKTKLLTETFNLLAIARDATAFVQGVDDNQIPVEALQAIRVAAGEQAASERRQQLKERYVELEAEMLAAVEARVARIEEQLAPKNASFQDYAAAASASEDALIAAMDLAVSSGDEDAALVAFAAARQRDLERAVAHAIDIREDWEELYAELSMAENDPEIDPGDRFEMFAQDLPTRQQILTRGGQPDINIYGQMGTG